MTCDIPTIFCNPEKFVGYHYINELNFYYELLPHDNHVVWFFMHALFIKSWVIPEATPEVCLEHVISAVAILSEKEKMHINKVSSCA